MNLRQQLQLFLVFFLIGTLFSANAAEIWVSPSGKDTNIGTKSSPLATVQMAVRKARELRRLKDPSIKEGIHIIIMNGTYYLDEPLFVRPEDSGTVESPNGKMDIGYINWIILKPLEYDKKKKLNLGTWTKLSKNIQENLGNLIADNRNVVLEKAKTFEKYFIEIRKELANQEQGFEIIVGNILENLLIDLYRQLSSKGQKTVEETNFIDKFTKIVSEDISKKWNIDDLANQFGMGKTKFTYEVKKLTGYPPNSYIINLKIEKAIALILNPKNKSMSDIAYSCGFSSIQHFTSSFLQRTGTTPGRYRTQETKNN